MKILILTNVYSGLYSFRKELIEALIQYGNRVIVIAPEDDYAEKIKALGAEITDIRLRRRGMNPFQDFSLFLNYIKQLKRTEPDVVLTYTVKPNIFGGLACRILNIPYIANITGLGTSIYNSGTLADIVLALYRSGTKKASQVMFQNRHNKVFFEKKVLKREGRLIPGSGVNLKQFSFSEYPENDGRIRLVCVTRIMKDKGIEEFLDCAEYIKAKYDNVSFDLVGDYDDKAYEQRIVSLHKQSVINYHGVQEDVAGFYKAGHALIQPSYHEGLSNVLLENAACGRPCISTDVPGCREVFDNGISGISCKAGDSKSLIEAVEKFIGLDYNLKSKMGKAARIKVENEFSRELVIGAYFEEIESAVR